MDAARIGVGEFLRAAVRTIPDVPGMAVGAAGLLSLKPTTVRSLGLVFQEAAARHPRRVFLRFEGVDLDYGEANRRVNRIASALAARGVGPGSTVGILAGNRPGALLTVLAAVKLGAVAGMLNHHQRGDVLDHSVRLLDAAVLVADDEHRDALPGAVDVDALAEEGTCDADPEQCARIEAGTTAFYVFTSGTTGLPKASAMSHLRWLKSMQGLGKLGVRLRGDDTLYCCLPLYHNNALTVSLSAVLGAGATFALGRSFSASRFWDEVARAGATAFCYVGELCRYLLNQPPSPAERAHRVRVAVGNGLRPELWDEFTERFGVPRVSEFYSASECNVAFINALNLRRTAGACPLPFTVVEHDPATGGPARVGGRVREVAVGEVGLLLTKVTDRAPFDGYTDPEATERKLVRDAVEDGDCWFDTGDLVRRQGFKHVAFVDRLGDTFRWKGENVATTEVEAAVDAFPGVEQSVVYGVPIPRAEGKAGMAAVKPAPGAEFDPAGLAEHLLGRLPGYAVPLFVRVVAELAQTSTFKSRKVDLRDQGYADVGADPLYVLSGGRYVPAYPDYADEVASGRIRS